MKCVAVFLIFSLITIHFVEMRCIGWCSSCHHDCKRRVKGNAIDLLGGQQFKRSNKSCKFETYDTDGDNLITWKELENVLDRPLLARANTAFLIMDENKNKIVTREEFSDALPVLLSLEAIDSCS